MATKDLFVTLTCAGCGIEFQRRRNQVRSNSRLGKTDHYHDPACYRKANRASWGGYFGYGKRK